MISKKMLALMLLCFAANLASATDNCSTKPGVSMLQQNSEQSRMASLVDQQDYEEDNGNEGEGLGSGSLSLEQVTTEGTTASPELQITNVIESNQKGSQPQIVPITGATVQYASDRGTYQFQNIAPKYKGSYYIQGENYKGIGDQGFTTNLPVIVYVVMDSRQQRGRNPPTGFVRSGSETMEFSHKVPLPGDPYTFFVYKKSFPAGQVRFAFKKEYTTGGFESGGMNGIFIAAVAEIQASATASASGTYSSHTPDKAIDGHSNTAWNAPAHPVQWLKLTWQRVMEIVSIEAEVAQHPSGSTSHEVYGDGVKLFTWSGTTSDGQKLTHTFTPAVQMTQLVIKTTTSPSWVAWREIKVVGK